RTQFPHGLKGASWAVSAIGIERDDCLSPESVLMQEALHGRRQLHIPSWKADKDEIVLIRSVDHWLERRQIAGLILADDLLDSGVIIGRIRRLQFESNQFAADHFVDESAMALVLFVRDRLRISILFSGGCSWAFF